jgi:hypothetical protein
MISVIKTLPRGGEYVEGHREKTFINPYQYYVLTIRPAGKSLMSTCYPWDLHLRFPVFAGTLSQLFPFFPPYTLSTPSPNT